MRRNYMKVAIVVIIIAMVLSTLVGCNGGATPAASSAAAATSAAATSAAATSAAPATSAVAAASATASPPAAPSEAIYPKGTPTATGTKTIAYLTMGFDSPYWVQVGNGIEDAAKDAGYKSELLNPKNDLGTQVSYMENLIVKKVDCIVLSSLDAAALEPLVKKAMDAGILVIGHATITPGQALHQGPNETEMGTAQGTAAGQWAAANWTDKHKVTGVSYYVQANPQTYVRETSGRAAFEKYYPNVEWVNEPGTINSLTLDDGTKNMEALLQAHPDISVVLSCCDDGILGSYQVAKRNNMDLSKMLFAGINGLPQTLQMMKDEKDAGGGAYRVTVDINGYQSGRDCVAIATSYFKGEKLKGDYPAPATGVTYDNIGTYFNADGTINFGADAYRKEHYKQ